MANIGIDLDEVLADHTTSFNEFHDEKYGTDLLNTEITKFYLNEMIDVTKEQERERIREYYDTKYFTATKPISGAVKAVKELAKDNNLYLITARPNFIAQETRDWITKYFPECFKEIVVTNHSFDDTKKKSKVCREKKIEIMVEDMADYANDCADVCRKVFLIDKPWNKQEKIGPKVTRVKGWEEIQSLILGN